MRRARNLRLWAYVLTLGIAVASQAALGQQVEFLSTDDALQLEHQTRFQRLKRLVETYGIYPAPQFFDYRVPSAQMPPNFRYDVPVLRIVFPENTFFETGSDVVLPSATPIILAMAKMLDGDVPDVNVFVAGHTDDRGGEDYNHNLSIRRARAVTAELAKARNQQYPIWSIGFGETLPVYPNTGDENMSYNRRVEFLLGAKPEAVTYWLQQQYDVVCQSGDRAEKLACMLGIRRLRTVFEAEETPRRLAVETDEPSRLASSAEGRRIASASPAQRKIVIKLNERRLPVSSVEH